MIPLGLRLIEETKKKIPDANDRIPEVRILNASGYLTLHDTSRRESDREEEEET